MMRRSVGVGFIFTAWSVAGILATSLGGTAFVWSGEPSLPSTTPDFPATMKLHRPRLLKIESDKSALELFASTLGPALRLEDAAKTLGGQALPVRISKELLVPQLTSAAQRLMGALAAWQFAADIREAMQDNRFDVAIPPGHTWLTLQDGTWASPYHEVVETVTTLKQPPAPPDAAFSAKELLSNRAAQLEITAIQAAYQEWDRLQHWKTQVRMLRGQVRLCGAWHWVIHNHQKQHHEQKLSLLFPPPGTSETGIPGLVETIVLGDNVYLRWETNGLVQEDSLQFVKDGQRLEGTFVSSQGGWGSISGKRTATCPLDITPRPSVGASPESTQPGKPLSKNP